MIMPVMVMVMVMGGTTAVIRVARPAVRASTAASVVSARAAGARARGRKCWPAAVVEDRHL
ncbi:hypothetical protein [Streptomyces exfoliatus]|uniref:hypothetical protein n=1 Tax=Streptomyces exfoliatus TaxID=1905 RepID=UPI00046416B9|nr:hypothetical protein [Streptomyces exfoliatus]